jgi:cytidylate kinase
MAERSISYEQAMQAVLDDDRQRDDFYRSYYGVRLDDPTLYDLTLNTGALDLETAGELVVLAVQRAGVPG